MLIDQAAGARRFRSLMELGALGSFFEGNHLAHQLPAFGFLEVRPPEIDGLVATLPPFYTSVAKITIGRVDTVAA